MLFRSGMEGLGLFMLHTKSERRLAKIWEELGPEYANLPTDQAGRIVEELFANTAEPGRSEERRVGKECRSRRSA